MLKQYQYHADELFFLMPNFAGKNDFVSFIVFRYLFFTGLRSLLYSHGL